MPLDRHNDILKKIIYLYNKWTYLLIIISIIQETERNNEFVTQECINQYCAAFKNLPSSDKYWKSIFIKFRKIMI